MTGTGPLEVFRSTCTERGIVSTTYKKIIAAIDGWETDVLAACQERSAAVVCVVVGGRKTVTDSP